MKKQRRIEKDNRDVAIYARKSGITNKGDSIGVQFKQCADYAKKELGLDEDYEFLQYEDKGLSGYFSDRPDFQRMLHDVQDGKIKAIVCYKLDRVGRKTADLGKLGYDNMGRLLDDELGDNYYAIGTDFYKTKCNLPNGSSGHRTNQVFYSYDPLAKAAMQAKLDICWLDFSYASKSPELSKWISDYHYMGSLGEGYAFWMRLLPPSYRKFQQPDEIYDSMIFVAEATPPVILNTQSD